MTTLYGISNCDTIRKAKKWLADNDIEFQFHDYRKDGLSEKDLRRWCKQLGWEKLLNKRGTTWRKLDPAQQAAINEALAIELMLEQPAMIKRPLLIDGKNHLLGFKPELYTEAFDV